MNKNVIDTFCISIAAVSLLLSSCASSDHMTFWGIPIDGPRQEFIKKMLKKTGSTDIYPWQDGMLIGPFEFGGQNDHCLIVSSRPDADIVSQVSLLYPRMYGWKEYEAKYNELKSRLTQQYGEPVESIEQFQDPNVKPRDKPGKFFVNEAQYSTLFYDDKGPVELSIRGYGYPPLYDVRVTVTYIDGINNENYDDVGDECWGEG